MAALTEAVVTKSMVLLRTASRPTRSSGSESRNVAATPTPMASTNAPRRQYPATTNPNAATMIRPTSRIGHCPPNTLRANSFTVIGSRPGEDFRSLDDVRQEKRPRQRADPTGVRRHVTCDLPHVGVHIADHLALVVAAHADVDHGRAGTYHLRGHHVRHP